MKFSVPIVITFILGIPVGAGGLFLLYKPIPTGNNSAQDSVTQFREVTTEGVDSNTSRYENKKYGFRMDYPKELIAREFDEGSSAMTIVFQKPGEQVGFQMFVVPYSETQISEVRIQQDLKGAAMNNPTEIILPGNIRAVHFESNSPIIGESVEVWFIKNGHLYEVTTYSDSDVWLAKILNTIEFTK